ncbi:hypothetical protein FRB97_004080 [Tulasnella sp. 331]|nr:hypothetical protein FRB97_004080 [Tulasnella sp. 331]
MYTLTRSPIASPAAIQHAFVSAFPSQSSISCATRSVAASPTLGSPFVSPRIHNTNYQVTTTARPRIFPLQTPVRTQSDSRLNMLHENKNAYTQLHPTGSPNISKGILLTPGTPRRKAMGIASRRPSFALNIDLGSITDKLVGLGITSSSTTSTSASTSTTVCSTTRATLKDRIPTPYPKKNIVGGTETFDWAMSESCQSHSEGSEVAWEVEPDYLPKVYDDTC